MNKKCKVVLLPTDKRSHLTVALHRTPMGLHSEEYIEKGEIYYSTYPVLKGNLQPSHIYIVSEDQIKEGNVIEAPCSIAKVKEIHWKLGDDKPSYIVEDIIIVSLRYGQKNNELQTNSFRSEHCKKIIAATDEKLIKEGIASIDDEFIREYCSNPVEEVKVEYKRVKTFELDNNSREMLDFVDKPKLSSNGSIIISPEDGVPLKEETWLLNLNREYGKYVTENVYKDIQVLSFPKWIQQNYEAPKKKQ